MPYCTENIPHPKVNMTSIGSGCLKHCSGLMVTSYNKYEMDKDEALNNFISKLFKYMADTMATFGDIDKKLNGKLGL